MPGSDPTPVPPRTPPEGPSRRDVPDAGEIEWAGGLVSTPPAPGEVRVDPDEASSDGSVSSDDYPEEDRRDSPD